MKFRTTDAAWDCLEETGCDLRIVARDIEYLRTGMHTAADLLARCLDGAEPWQPNPAVALYTVERHVPGAPSPVRYDERPLPDACDLATLLAWSYPAARVEVHGRQGLAGIVTDGAVRHPYTGDEL